MPVDAKTKYKAKKIKIVFFDIETPFVSKKQVIFQSLLRLFSKDLKKKES